MFIEFRNLDGVPNFVNLNRVDLVSPAQSDSGYQTNITFSDGDFFACMEPYEEVCARIARATKRYVVVDGSNPLVQP